MPHRTEMKAPVQNVFNKEHPERAGRHSVKSRFNYLVPGVLLHVELTL